jgi:hypothetical protein
LPQQQPRCIGWPAAMAAAREQSVLTVLVSSTACHEAVQAVRWLVVK